MSDEKYEGIGTNQDKVIEECGEVLMAIGKFNRFGPENFHPDRPESNNAIELLHEIDDAVYAMQQYRKELYKNYIYKVKL